MTTPTPMNPWSDTSSTCSDAASLRSGLLTPGPSAPYIDVHGSTLSSLPRLASEKHPLTAARQERWKRRIHASALAQPLDRVNVLGGHTGCVNALSWARDGEVLVSGGDDKTVRLWRIDPSDAEKAYPFKCRSVIRTGHTNNIFNAQMLPWSSRIATVAGDGQVRVCDVGDARGEQGSTETVYSTRDALVYVSRSHGSRVKRIVTEESPDTFLTVSEDGTVRQHDLRRGERAGEPLIEVPFELSTLSLSPLTPYQLVVAGDSPYGYLFDRRSSKRHLAADWGMPPNDDSLTTCVRRFGRQSRAPGERAGTEHITGSRMSAYNGHEVLLTYSSDAVYLYSTLDDPESQDSMAHGTPSPSTIPPSPKRRKVMSDPEHNPWADNESDVAMRDGEEDDPVEEDEPNAEEDDDDDDDPDITRDTTKLPFDHVPIVLARRRFTGACNVETVKDVNFLGPEDEFIVSGSDDGNWFMWNKLTGALHGIYDGDESVVNVIEGHPHFPLVAVSGIDHTVKLFSPVQGPRKFSRLDDAEAIIKQNADSSQRSTGQQIELAFLYRQYHLALRAVARQRDGDTDGEDALEGDGTAAESQCLNQ